MGDPGEVRIGIQHTLAAIPFPQSLQLQNHPNIKYNARLPTFCATMKKNLGYRVSE
jgi:hypothetical protein